MKTAAKVMFATLTALLISQLTAPVQGLPAPGADFVVQPREPRAARDHCHQIHSCHFYSHCIESVFPCGQQGFTLSYAAQRCQEIDRIHPLVGRNARVWAHSTEECFREKLLNLVDRYVSDTHHPDPHTCLDFEKEAIDMMNSCYVEGHNGHMLHTVPEGDLRKIVSLFRVDPAYHNITVDSGLVRHIADRKGHTFADSLLSNHTLSMPNRILFCIKGDRYPHGVKAEEVEPTPEEFVTVLSAELHKRYTIQDSGSFEYAGLDDWDELCTSRLQSEHLVGLINTDNNDYHIVSWFTTDDFDELLDIGDVRYDEEIFVHGAIFELTSLQGNFSRQRTRCGDGKRQVSESCDFSFNYPGCSLDCRPMAEYDCTVDKLQPSTCWLQECGDGMRSRSELCDDGNLHSNDGCSVTCKIEHTHTCTRDYNMTSECTTILTPLQQKVEPASAKLIAQATSHVTSRHAPASDSHSQQQHTKRTVQPAALSSASRALNTWSPLYLLAAMLGLVCTNILR